MSHEADRPAAPARPFGEPLPIHLVGNVNLDIVLGPVQPWPRAGTERIVAHQEVRAGGAAGVAAMALQGLGAPFRLHARVGDDAFGELVQRDMGRAGAQLEPVPGSTAYSVGITHPDGERTFLTHLGHLKRLDVDGLAEDLTVGPPGLVLVCGYFLMPPLRGAAGLRLMRSARDAGHRVLFDSGWPSEGFDAAVRGELDALLPWIDVALPNVAEALGWTAAADLEAALRALQARQRGGGRALVKRGPAGASWLEDGSSRTAAPPAAPIVDSIGAGDCFNAALLADLSRGSGLGAAAGAAVRYASAVLARQPRDYRG